jgi:hypothetical protein
VSLRKNAGRMPFEAQGKPALPVRLVRREGLELEFDDFDGFGGGWFEGGFFGGVFSFGG